MNADTRGPGRRADARTAGGRDDVLVDAACRTLRDLHASSVALFLPVQGEPILGAAVAAVEPLGVGLMERLPMDDEIFPSVAAYKTGRPKVAHSIDTLGKYPEFAVFVPYPLTIASAPLESAGKRFGAIAAFWPGICRHIRPDELDRLSAVGREVARELIPLAAAGVSMQAGEIPLVTAMCTVSPAAGDDTVRDAEVAPFLYHIQQLALRLTGALSLEDVVQVVNRRVVAGLKARATVITSLENGRLRVVGASGCSQVFLRRLEVSSSRGGMPEERAMTEKSQLFFDTSHPETRDRVESAAGEGAEEYVWVVSPLMAGTRVLGTCSIGFTADGRHFAAERAALHALVPLLGQAFERIRAEEASHALARQLQQALLPRMLPSIPGLVSTSRYVPASGGLELGGDWYDLIPVPAGGVTAVIGDVQGHSTAATVVMGQLRSAVRAYATDGAGPGSLLRRTNRLLGELKTDLFATCCCALLDPETGCMRVATAGHPFPLIRQASGDYLDPRADVGPPLGVDAEYEYSDVSVHLDPGALVAFYTDGFLRAGPGHEMSRGVIDGAFAVSHGQLEAIGDEVVKRTTVFPRAVDDAALLLLRYEEPSAQARHFVQRLEIARRDLRGVQRARLFLRAWLAAWSLNALHDEAQLLLSEVVTNALVHADSDVDLRVRRYPHYLRVEVRDSDPHPAINVGRPGEAQAEGGRGMMIVSTLASAWGNSPSGRGKTVWFELPF
ncbi:SpoIIE family protein phosphatase [Streptomyces sp. NPDC102462]|uniref:ATP-binding SpoIIE family protein phosphatase n=1 Tax=Streptomyces sp. NPDC102462 TaxID=3366178 RepID=UPI00381F6A91